MNRFHFVSSFSHCWHKLTTVYDYVDVLPALVCRCCCYFYLLLSLFVIFFLIFGWFLPLAQRQDQIKNQQTNTQNSQELLLILLQLQLHFVISYITESAFFIFQSFVVHFEWYWMISVCFSRTIFAASQSATNMNWKEWQKSGLSTGRYCTLVVAESTKHLWINSTFHSLFGTTTNYGLYLYVSISMDHSAKTKNLFQKNGILIYFYV